MAVSSKGELLIMVAPELQCAEDIDEIYKWVDSVSLSRVKKNINRDFADGVLMAEMARHYFPTAVEMHNYPSVQITVFFQSHFHYTSNWMFYDFLYVGKFDAG